MKSLIVAVPFLAPIWAAPAPSADLYPTWVTIDSGPIIGLQTNLPDCLSPVNQFLGIPYTEPPVRFEPSTPPKKWNEPLEVKEFGASCPENYGWGSLGPDPTLLRTVFGFNITESEDCLTINVFAPASKDTQGRAVLVFIPGGGFQLGNSALDLSPFAAYEDIVIVSFNYRTNVFGFPPSSAIPPSERNLAFLDQRLALEWVQSNIAHFGGDPSKVTIWGQSAGSHSVDQHLRSYHNSSSPPFRAAIMSSGQMSFGWTALPSPGTEQWIALASIVGCPGEEDQEDARLECLKAKPKDDLINGMLTGELTFSPSFDGVTALSGGGKAWKEGNAVKVPILTGTMAEEGTVLIGPNATMEEFLGAYLPAPPFTEEMVQGLVGVYRADARLESDFDVMAALYSDFLFKCPQTMLATAASAHQPTYLYYGNFTATNLLGPEFAWLGKFHGAELFLMSASPTDERHTPSSRALANTLRGIFARFTRNPGNGPGWDPVHGEDNTAKDLAVIGDVGSEETSGLAMRTRGEAGTRCEIYADIYAAMEQILA